MEKTQINKGFQNKNDEMIFIFLLLIVGGQFGEKV
jgi:hypothetical protein